MPNVTFPQVVAMLRSAVGLASLALVCVGVLRAWGVGVPYFNIGTLDLSALAIAAAYVSK